MSLEELSKNTSSIKSQVEQVVEDSISYYKLLGFKIVTKSATKIVKTLIISALGFLFILFTGIAGGFALGHYWNNYTYGFLAVAGGYLVLLLLVVLLSKYLIDRPILKNSSKILNDKNLL